LAFPEIWSDLAEPVSEALGAGGWRVGAAQSASSPVSPVRMRIACSIGRDEDLAVADLVGLGRGDDRVDGGIDLVVGQHTSIFTLGRKSTTYSAPR
jgi:hypothetical protein